MQSIQNNKNRGFFKTPFTGVYTVQIKSLNNLNSVNSNNVSVNNLIKIAYPINKQKQFSNNPFFSKTIR
jgi:hypothetical protein